MGSGQIKFTIAHSLTDDKEEIINIAVTIGHSKQWPIEGRRTDDN